MRFGEPQLEKLTRQAKMMFKSFNRLTVEFWQPVIKHFRAGGGGRRYLKSGSKVPTFFT